MLFRSDYKKKEVGIIASIMPDQTDIEEAIRKIRSYFDSSMAKYPQQFADL